MRFYYVALEPMPERFSEQVNEWIECALGEISYEVCSYYPEMNIAETKPGDFLGWRQRAVWSLKQTQWLIEIMDSIEDDDVIFFADIWNPGLEAIHYVRALEGRQFSMYGINYAGPFDVHDRLAEVDSAGFGAQEAAMYQMLDGVFVGSRHHKDEILVGLGEMGIAEKSLRADIHVTGLVWEPDEVALIDDFKETKRRPIVIWPHRWASEKDPGLLILIAKEVHESRPDIRFIVSTSRSTLPIVDLTANSHIEFVSQDKASYYEMLHSSSLMLSTAYQETYGYTVQEAARFNTPVLAPNRASYPEFVHPDGLFDDEREGPKEIARRIIDHVEQTHQIPLTMTRQELTGIDLMVRHIKDKECIE
jgi:glycosyltransferase involved in cell wall biosynthesis